MEQDVQAAQPRSGKKRIGCWIAGCLTALVVVVLFIGSIIGVALWATKGPVKVVNEQLAYLRKGDIEGAYNLTSGDFRKATSLEQFKQFVASYPFLSQNKSASFTSREIKNNRGHIEGTLTAMDGSRTPVKYDLIKENNEWKILYIELSTTDLQPTPEKEQVSYGETNIEKIEVGTERSPDGSIQDPGVKFPQGIGDIKVSAYITGSKKGQWVSAIWYLGSQPVSSPAVDLIAEDGDYICKFYLSPPSNGWPTGNYKVVISIDKDKVIKEASYSIGL